MVDANITVTTIQEALSVHVEKASHYKKMGWVVKI